MQTRSLARQSEFVSLEVDDLPHDPMSTTQICVIPSGARPLCGAIAGSAVRLS